MMESKQNSKGEHCTAPIVTGWFSFIKFFIWLSWWRKILFSWYYYQGIVGGIVGGCGCCFLQAANVTNSIMFCREQKLVGKLLVRITIEARDQHNSPGLSSRDPTEVRWIYSSLYGATLYVTHGNSDLLKSFRESF